MGVAGIHRFSGSKSVNETPRVPHYLVGDAEVGRAHTSMRRGTGRWLSSYLSTALRTPEAARPWLGLIFFSALFACLLLEACCTEKPKDGTDSNTYRTQLRTYYISTCTCVEYTYLL